MGRKWSALHLAPPLPNGRLPVWTAGFKLAPKQHSSRGKDRLASISKGDGYLRSLFVAGALCVIRYAKIHGTKYRPWLTALLAGRPTKIATIALAQQARPHGLQAY